MNVQKFINKGMTYEIGDFFDGDTEQDVIKKMVIENHMLLITTNHTQEFPIHAGAWAKFEDGTSMTFEDDDTDNA
jgi:hypothetical protein